MSKQRDIPDELPYLRTFAQAAELGSFTAAARALGLTQAAISQRIQALERALDVSLFQRQAGRVLPTDAGRRLYDYAQRILELQREAWQEVAGHAMPISGELALGASTIPGEHLLPRLLSLFRDRYPGIHVKATIADSDVVLGQVEQGKVNLGLVGKRSVSPHLEFRAFASDRIVVVVPPQHAWKCHKEIATADLVNQPLILREAGSGLRASFEKAVEGQGRSMHDLDVALELGSNEAIKSAVRQGLGAAVLSSLAIADEVAAGHLHALELADVDLRREMFVVWDRRRVLSAPARTFRIFLENQPVDKPR